MKAQYFSSPAEFRRWLAAHHATARELLVGFHKAHTKKPSLTWSESVDEAVCFGWIDGIRRSVDANRYTIRFTPRKPSSVWSKINIAKVQVLEEAGRMTDAGRRAFAHKKENRAGTYSYEQRPEKLPAPYRKVLDQNRKAAKDFDARTGSYRRAAVWWVISAKTESTRERRLSQLVALHAQGELIPAFAPRRAAKKPIKGKTRRASGRISRQLAHSR